MQWKARYSDGEEIWETPQTSSTTLDRSRLASFELVEDGIVKHRWALDQSAEFDYRVRTRIPLLAEGESETFCLVSYGGWTTAVYNDRTETSKSIDIL